MIRVGENEKSPAPRNGEPGTPIANWYDIQTVPFAATVIDVASFGGKSKGFGSAYHDHAPS